MGTGMTPKQPTPASVSATLRTAGFRASRREQRGAGMAWTEGYMVARHGYTPCVAVEFVAGDGDSTILADALTKMTAALRHKGWLVRQYPDFLVVEEPYR